MTNKLLLCIFVALFSPLSVLAGTLDKADLVIVYKKERLLLLYKNKRQVARYEIALGFEPVGDKHFEGDGKTPEGVYKIISKREHPLYHKSLKISYPNKVDIAYASSKGLSPGGEILIHGIREPYGFVGGLQDLIDWTRGCIAVTDNEIDEIYDLVDVGTPVWIFADFKK